MGGDSNANRIVRNIKMLSALFIDFLDYLIIRARLIVTVSQSLLGWAGASTAGPVLVSRVPGPPSCWQCGPLFEGEVASGLLALLFGMH